MSDHAEKTGLSIDRISIVLFLGILTAIFFTFRQYGISWDEPAQREIGILSLRYYASSFKDLSAVSPDYFNRIYGGCFEMIAEMGASLAGDHPYETRHLFNALAGFAGIVGCWRLARQIGGPMAGFWAIAFMIFFPTYIGHMFNNPKDIPFAAAYIWSVYFLIRALSKPGSPGFLSFLAFGFAAGITSGIRAGGLVLFAVAGIGLAVFVLCRMACRYPGVWCDIGKAVLFLPVAFAAAFAVMLLFWPWAQQSPVKNTLYALQFFSNWNGSAGDPWYILQCFSKKIPEAIFTGLCCALFLVVWKARSAMASLRSGDQENRARLIAFALLAASFIVPISYIVIKRSVLYNEMRQVIFVTLPMVVCGAIAVSAIFRMLCKRPAIRIAFCLAIAGLLSLPAYSIVQLYPYHYIYCNTMSGGLNALGREFTYEYYLHSYKELALQLNRFVSGGFHEPRLKLFVHGSPQCMAYYLPRNVEIVDSPEKADLAAYNPLNFQDTRKGREIGAVWRCGVKMSTLRLYFKGK